MDDKLRILVTFAALDKLAAPIRRLRDGSKGLARDIGATSKKMGELKRAEAQVANYKGVEERWRQTNKELQAARKRTADLRAEIAKVDSPTKRMTASLGKLEALEAKANHRHDEQGDKLQELGRKLHSAGIDVTNLGHAEDRLGKEMYDTNKLLGRQREQLERVERVKARSRGIRAAGGKMMAGGAIMTASVSVPIVSAFAAAIPEAVQARQATAQVAAALKSMGNASGRTLDQLQDLSGQLQDISLFDDDDIMQKVTANMLTFGTIAGKNFDRAQLAAINLSQRLGQDLQSSTIQVGKALNDPVKGITALRRVGIQFTEEQKDQIKTLVEHGKAAKAQALILDELQREFGGAAQAARKANPSAAFDQELRTMKENMGEMALTVLPDFLREATKLMKAFNNMTPEQKQATTRMLEFAVVLGPIITALGAMVTVIGWLAPLFSWLFGLFRVGVSGARPIMVFFEGFLAVLRWLATPIMWIVRILGVAIGAIAAFLGIPVWLVIAIIAALAAAGAAIWYFWDDIKSGFATAWAWLKSTAITGINWFLSLNAQMVQIGVNLVMGIINGVGSMFGALKAKIVALGKGAVDWFKGVLGIHSPSRVFAVLGGHMMGGLALGIDRQAGAPISRVRAAATGMIAAMATSSLAAAPAMARTPVGAGGSSPAGRSAAAGSSRDGDHYEIHIHGAGKDAQAIADEVMRRIDDTKRARERSSYRDEDA
jgi:hypothetical protein